MYLLIPSYSYIWVYIYIQIHIYIFNYLFIHLCIYAFIQLFIYSFNHSSMDLCLYIYNCKIYIYIVCIWGTCQRIYIYLFLLSNLRLIYWCILFAGDQQIDHGMRTICRFWPC